MFLAVFTRMSSCLCVNTIALSLNSDKLFKNEECGYVNNPLKFDLIHQGPQNHVKLYVGQKLTKKTKPYHVETMILITVLGIYNNKNILSQLISYLSVNVNKSKVNMLL